MFSIFITLSLQESVSTLSKVVSLISIVILGSETLYSWLNICCISAIFAFNLSISFASTAQTASHSRGIAFCFNHRLC